MCRIKKIERIFLLQKVKNTQRDNEREDCKKTLLRTEKVDGVDGVVGVAEVAGVVGMVGMVGVVEVVGVVGVVGLVW